MISEKFLPASSSLSTVSLLVCLHIFRVWGLWFQSHATAQKFKMLGRSKELVSKDGSMSAGHGESGEGEPEEPWCIRNRHLISDKFLLRLFLAKTVPEVLLIWANFIFDPSSLTQRLGENGSKLCRSIDWAFYVYICAVAYSMLLLAYAATRYGTFCF